MISALVFVFVFFSTRTTITRVSFGFVYLNYKIFWGVSVDCRMSLTPWRLQSKEKGKKRWEEPTSWELIVTRKCHRPQGNRFSEWLDIGSNCRRAGHAHAIHTWWWNLDDDARVFINKSPPASIDDVGRNRATYQPGDDDMPSFQILFSFFLFFLSSQLK